jgi:MFS family permease
MAGAVALPLILVHPAALALSSLLVGTMVPAIITLTAGTVHVLSPPARQRQIWGWATLSFAATQAVGGFAMARLYGATGSYRATIAAGAALLVVALACAIAGGVGARRHMG